MSFTDVGAGPDPTRLPRCEQLIEAVDKVTPVDAICLTSAELPTIRGLHKTFSELNVAFERLQETVEKRREVSTPREALPSIDRLFESIGTFQGNPTTTRRRVAPSHNNFPNQTYDCRFCTRRFTQVKDRDAHELESHEHRCEPCLKAFASKYSLSRHTHTRKPRKCPDCDREYVRFDHFQKYCPSVVLYHGLSAENIHRHLEHHRKTKRGAVRMSSAGGSALRPL